MLVDVGCWLLLLLIQIDSMMGGSVQYSGIDRKSGKVINFPIDNCEWISGRHILDNHQVNLLSSLLMTLICGYLGSLLICV